MARKKRKKTKESTRNLVQYKNLTDEEFDEVWENMEGGDDFLSDFVLGSGDFQQFKARVAEKMEQFSADYDLSDMKFNDTQVLERLCSDLVTLEDYEKLIFNLRNQPLTSEILYTIDTLTSMMDKIGKTVSKTQDDLKISRKSRENDKELDLIGEIESQKRAAAKFYEKVMTYVYCEKCTMLLATTWMLYPQSANTLEFTCNRLVNDETGEFCNHVTKITSKELMARKGTNHPEQFKF